MSARPQWLAQREVPPWFGCGSVKRTSGQQRRTGRWKGIETQHDTHEAYAGPIPHHDMSFRPQSTATEKFVHRTGVLTSGVTKTEQHKCKISQLQILCDNPSV